MRRLLTIVVGFLHDFAAGLWAASVLAVFWLERALASAASAPAAGSLQAVQAQFFWLGVGSIVVVMATGAGRTFTYVEGFYGAEAERARRRMLVLKHVLMVAVFGLGTWWQYGMAFG